jgi:hypothetical protein
MDSHLSTPRRPSETDAAYRARREGQGVDRPPAGALPAEAALLRRGDADRANGEISIYEVLTPVVRGWRTVATLSLLFAALTAAITLSMPRKYRASVALSTVVNPRIPSLPGGLGALLNTGNVGGLQSTPALVVLLAGQRGVLERVNAAPVVPGQPQTIGDRLRIVEERELLDRELPAVLGGYVQSAFDRQTGVISIDVVSDDSTFARAVVRELVAEISRTFVRASKAQGAELRQAMDVRVDSAGRSLRRAQEVLRAFRASNREVATFSAAGIEEANLERALSLAQTVHGQAVTDRESAIARELENTPAVVVLDSLARELPPEPRRTVIKVAAAGLTGLVLAVLALLLRAGVERAATGQPERLREFAGALARIPLVGGLMIRLLGVPRFG